MLMLRSQERPSRRWRRYALFLGVWTALGLFDAVDTHIKNSQRLANYGFAIPTGQAVFLGLSLWYAWGVLSLAAAAFVRRYPITRATWWHRLPLAVAFAVLLALVKLATDYPAVEAFCCPAPGLMPYTRFLRIAFTSQFHSYVLTSLGILGTVHALSALRATQQRQQEARRLEERLNEAQLAMLSAQLPPHFLFNTLNAVSHLVRHDPAEADRVLARLGDLLRHLLDASAEEAVPLAQEIAFVRAYLDIERARFGDRLEVVLDVEPGLDDVPVPPLSLQPLVENAVVHGAARTDRPARVEVRARREGDRLRLEVWNDAPEAALPEPRRRRKSLGLAATRARLSRLFGDDARLDLCRSGPGVLAVLEIPYFDEPAALAS